MRRKQGIIGAPVRKDPPRKRGAEYVRPVKKADYPGVKRLRFWLTVLGVLILVLGGICAVYALVRYGIPAVKNAVYVSSAPVYSAETSEKPDDSSTPLLDGDGRPVYDDTFYLQLVNAQHPVQESPQQLTAYRDIVVDTRMLPALQEMEKAAAAWGVEWRYLLGYVTTDEQQERYAIKVEQLIGEGMSAILAQSTAEKYVPKAGNTDLHTGLSFLLPMNTAQENPEALRWLTMHATEYGFILRYPKGNVDITGVEGEPPLFRYVGTQHAVQMRYLSMCLEDYCAYVAER